ncbi:PAS domain-containing protein, partial [Vibrio parahaemolyticus]
KNNLGYLNSLLKISKQLETFIGSEIQRKRIERDLSYLFDAIPDIISLSDLQGRILRINKTGSELIGYAEEEIINEGFEKFIHPDDLQIAYEELSKLGEGNNTFGFEVRFITKSGKTIWLSWYCKSNVKEGLIYATAKNITKEKYLSELN